MCHLLAKYWLNTGFGIWVDVTLNDTMLDRSWVDVKLNDTMLDVHDVANGDVELVAAGYPAVNSSTSPYHGWAWCCFSRKLSRH